MIDMSKKIRVMGLHAGIVGGAAMVAAAIATVACDVYLFKVLEEL